MRAHCGVAGHRTEHFVAPFPQRAITQTLMDRSFFAWPEVWIGAGTERHMAALPPADLARLTRARPIDLAARG